MKYFIFFGLCSCIIFENCGPSAEELEAQRISDSTIMADSLIKIQAENQRIADSFAKALAIEDSLKFKFGNFSKDFRLDNSASSCQATHYQADDNDIWWSEQIKNNISIIFQSEKRILLIYFDRSLYRKYNNIKAIKEFHTLTLSNNQYNDIIKILWADLSFSIKYKPYDGRNHYYEINYMSIGYVPPDIYEIFHNN
jgi:hypothetical protein